MGEEADDGRTHEDAGVAECGDGRDGCADRHVILTPYEAVEYRNDVRTADTDGEEARIYGEEPGQVYEREKTEECEQRTTDDDTLCTEAVRYAVTCETHDEHCGGEDGKARACTRHVEIADGGQKYATPVHDGAFHEKCDTCDDTDECHDAAWDGDETTATTATIREEPAVGDGDDSTANERGDDR